MCNALPHGGQVDHVLDLVEGFLVSEHVVELRPGCDAATIRLRDRSVVGARTDESRWTTPEILELEARLVDTARQGQASQVGVTARAVVDAVIGGQPTLTEEQAGMVRTICTSGDEVEIVEGVAGAGKTFALNAARQAWAASGYRVIGCSLAARPRTNSNAMPVSRAGRSIGSSVTSTAAGRCSMPEPCWSLTKRPWSAPASSPA